MAKNGRMIMFPNSDGAMRGDDPLGLTGGGGFSREDLKDPRYQPLISKAMKLLKEQKDFDTIRLLRNTLFEIYNSNEFDLFDEKLGEASSGTNKDKKTSLLMAFILVMILNAEININVDINVNDLVRLLIDALTPEHLEMIEEGKGFDENELIET